MAVCGCSISHFFSACIVLSVGVPGWKASAWFSVGAVLMLLLGKGSNASLDVRAHVPLLSVYLGEESLGPGPADAS